MQNHCSPFPRLAASLLDKKATLFLSPRELLDLNVIWLQETAGGMVDGGNGELVAYLRLQQCLLGLR